MKFEHTAPEPWRLTMSGTGEPDSAKKHPDTGLPFQEPCGIVDARGRHVAGIGMYHDRMVVNARDAGKEPDPFDQWLAEKRTVANILLHAPTLFRMCLEMSPTASESDREEFRRLFFKITGKSLFDADWHTVVPPAPTPEAELDAAVKQIGQYL